MAQPGNFIAEPGSLFLSCYIVSTKEIMNAPLECWHSHLATKQNIHTINSKLDTMKKIIKNSLFFLLLSLIQVAVFSQENLKQTGNEVKGWFSQNWPWVIGGGLVLLIIIAVSSGKRSSRKTTTIVKDDYGNVKSITSTEVTE